MKTITDEAIIKASKIAIESMKAFNKLIKRTDLKAKDLKNVSEKIDFLIFHKGYTAEKALKKLN